MSGIRAQFVGEEENLASESPTRTIEMMRTRTMVIQRKIVPSIWTDVLFPTPEKQKLSPKYFEIKEENRKKLKLTHSAEWSS